MTIANERPQSPRQGRRVQKPPTAIVLVLAHRRNGVANRANPIEIAVQPFALPGKELFRRVKRSIKAVWQNKGLAKKRTSNFVQIADVDERDVAIKAEGLQDRRLWILGIEPIDLMKRSLDCKGAMPIDRRRSAKILVSLDHQNLMAGPRIQRPGGQAAKPGADNDGVELSGHAQPRSMRIFLMARQFEFLS